MYHFSCTRTVIVICNEIMICLFVCTNSPTDAHANVLMQCAVCSHDHEYSIKLLLHATVENCMVSHVTENCSSHL